MAPNLMKSECKGKLTNDDVLVLNQLGWACKHTSDEFQWSKEQKALLNETLPELEYTKDTSEIQIGLICIVFAIAIFVSLCTFCCLRKDRKNQLLKTKTIRFVVEL